MMLPTLGSIPISSKMLKWYHNGPNDVVAVSKDRNQMVLLHNGNGHPRAFLSVSVCVCVCVCVLCIHGVWAQSKTCTFVYEFCSVSLWQNKCLNT